MISSSNNLTLSCFCFWWLKVVMRAIRKVAATRRAVICTIHQPSTYLFEMFDALLLLKKGGQPVFFGPLGESSSSLISYFQVTARNRRINRGFLALPGRGALLT